MVQATWRSHTKAIGADSRHCRVCNNARGIIRKYGLMICRRCFREYANDIGFKKVRFATFDLSCMCNMPLNPYFNQPIHQIIEMRNERWHQWTFSNLCIYPVYQSSIKIRSSWSSYRQIRAIVLIHNSFFITANHLWAIVAYRCPITVRNRRQSSILLILSISFNRSMPISPSV